MRDLFFKTTHPRHPSRLLRFVYSFLRVRNQVVFFVRPRSRNSAFLRLMIFRKMFSWFYTDRFTRFKRFKKLIRTRTTNFRSFLDFCTTLETTVPVILYRFHMIENMQDGFTAVRAGCVFKNGQQLSNPLTTIHLGDFVELFAINAFKILSVIHLIKCLPTLRIRLTLQDSIVNTALFYSQFVRFYSLLAIFDLPSKNSLKKGLENSVIVEKILVLNLYHYFSKPLARLQLSRYHVSNSPVMGKKSGVARFWWSGTQSRLLLRTAESALTEENYELSDFPTFKPDTLILTWDLKS